MNYKQRKLAQAARECVAQLCQELRCSEKAARAALLARAECVARKLGQAEVNPSHLRVATGQLLGGEKKSVVSGESPEVCDR